jgi:hypothetical protein
MVSGMFGAIQTFMARPPRLSTAIAAFLPGLRAGCPGTYDVMNSGGQDASA